MESRSQLQLTSNLTSFLWHYALSIALPPIAVLSVSSGPTFHLLISILILCFLPYGYILASIHSLILTYHHHGHFFLLHTQRYDTSPHVTASTEASRHFVYTGKLEQDKSGQEKQIRIDRWREEGMEKRNISALLSICENPAIWGPYRASSTKFSFMRKFKWNGLPYIQLPATTQLSTDIAPNRPNRIAAALKIMRTSAKPYSRWTTIPSLEYAGQEIHCNVPVIFSTRRKHPVAYVFSIAISVSVAWYVLPRVESWIYAYTARQLCMLCGT